MRLIIGYIIGIVFLSVVLFLPGCTNSIRNQLDKMHYVSPPTSVVMPVREWVRQTFKCPPGAKTAYLLGEMELDTNKARVGIRCE